MNSKVLFASGLFCWASLLVQLGQGVDISFAGGTLIAAGTTATTTWAAGPAILAGLLLAKVVGLGIFAASRRGRRRGKRDVGSNDIDFVAKESEAVFRQLEETDPAHCFRRYVCDLSTGLLDENNSDHLAILNLVSDSLTNRSVAFEYGIAASVGKRFGSLDVCEEMYDCPVTGNFLDHMIF